MPKRYPPEIRRQVVDVLQALVAARGAPTHVRCNNGPEMTAHALID